MKVHCGDCSIEVPSEDVNPGEGFAYCRQCGSLTSLAQLLSDAKHGLDDVDVDRPPAGCSIRDFGPWTSVRASLRSLAPCGFFIPFTLFWNSILSVFVAQALGSTIRLMTGSVPAWFPMPASDPMELGELLFLWLFLVPFIGVGFVTAALPLIMAVGSVEVRTGHRGGAIRTGVGPLRWTKRFDPVKVEAVRIGLSKWHSEGEHSPLIEIALEGGRKIQFGSMLSDERRGWMTKVLRRMLVVREARAGVERASGVRCGG